MPLCNRRKRWLLSSEGTGWIAVWAYLCSVIVIVNIGIDQLNDFIDLLGVLHHNIPKFAGSSEMSGHVSALLVRACLFTICYQMSAAMSWTTVGTMLIDIWLFISGWWSFSSQYFRSLNSCGFFWLDFWRWWVNTSGYSNRRMKFLELLGNSSFVLL